MAIKKLDNGKWEARISYRDETGKVKNKQKRFNLKREAEAFEFQFKQDLKQNINDSMTYNELFELYNTHNRETANERTINEQYYIANLFWSHFFKRKVVNISKADYNNIRLKISRSDYSVSSKNKFIKLLKSVAKFGDTYYDLPNNAKSLQLVKKNSLEHNDMNVWTVDELNQFLPHVDNTMLRILFHFLFYTGLRIGEARSLLRSDLRDNSISVTKTIRSAKRGSQPLKTASSRRLVVLDDVTLSLIEKLLEGEGSYIFGGLEPIGGTTVNRAWNKAFETASVKRIRIHDLRHSHASMLINNDVNIVAVSRRLGHSSIEITLKVYTHLLEETNEKLIEVINNKAKFNVFNE